MDNSNDQNPLPIVVPRIKGRTAFVYIPIPPVNPPQEGVNA